MAGPLLFAFGGSPSLDEAQRRFVAASGAAEARLVLLLVRRPGWEEYLPRYVNPWRSRGVRRWDVIIPDNNGQLDVKAAGALIDQATGIFIGGGHTETYHRHYGEGDLAKRLRARYEAGAPLAGSSAGALLMPQLCCLSPWDTDSGQPLMLPGLGVLAHTLISVHFTSRNDCGNILRAMRETKTRAAYGIDDDACAVFSGGTFLYALACIA